MLPRRKKTVAAGAWKLWIPWTIQLKCLLPSAVVFSNSHWLMLVRRPADSCFSTITSHTGITDSTLFD